MPELFSAGAKQVMAERENDVANLIPENLELQLTRSGLKEDGRRSSVGGRNSGGWAEKLRTAKSSDVSETTTSESGTGSACRHTKLLRLFL